MTDPAAVSALAELRAILADDGWSPGSLAMSRLDVIEAGLTGEPASGLSCTHRGCGKPENDPIHPTPDQRMGVGRHVFRRREGAQR